VAGAGRPRLTRVGRFDFPAGVTPAQPAALGQALGEFLRRQGFAARSAVVGVPARWLLTKKKDVPPVDAATATGILRLQAESDFSAEADDLICDYAGQTSDSSARTVLLLGLPRRHVSEIAQLASAARLSLVAVTPYSATLASVLPGSNGDVRAVLLGPGGAELIARAGGEPRVLRYLGSATAPASVLAGEVRRASLGLPSGGPHGA